MTRAKLVGLVLILVMLVSTGALAAPRETGHDIDKITFVHYYNPHAKPQGKPSGGGGSGYKLLPGGLHLAEPASYNLQLGEGAAAISAAVTEWNTWAGTEKPFAGGGESENAIRWGDLASNVIAVTEIRRDAKAKVILSFTITFNKVDFSWYTGTGDPGGNQMDLQNIATHEFGHAIGLGDLYSPVTSEQTMFGYSDTGEVYKRTLADGDKAGVLKLYP